MGLHSLLAVAPEEMSTGQVIFGLLSLPALISSNGFFVAAEFALVSVRRTRIEEMEAQGVKGAKTVATAIDKLDQSIAATQLGVTLSSIGLGFLTESALVSLFMSTFSHLEAPWLWVASHTTASILAFALITFLHVVIGELFPKSLALQAPDTISLWLARPLLLFSQVARPVIWLMNKAAILLLQTFGFAGNPRTMAHSVEELALLIEDTEEAGVLDADQAELVRNVFRLTEKEVRDCMVPVEKMAALELGMAPERVLDAVRSGAHTRMPVYSKDINNIVGIVNTKDLFFLFSLRGVVVLEDALYPALYLKPDEEIANALRLFRKVKRPMALVRDEEERILGVITLEDILEEIIGDIEDEHDRAVPKVWHGRPVKRVR